MTLAEAEGRATRVQILKEVAVISDAESRIFRAIAVGMADQGGLPVVMEVVVRERNTAASVGDIKKTIIAAQYGQ